jgi:hypothetical protein
MPARFVLPVAVLLAAVPALAGPVPLAPHRAVYELTIDPSKTSMRVDQARGRIAFEMTGNDCEGYAVSLRQVTELDTGEGKQSTSDLRSITWEDGAAKSYRFKSQNFVNREVKDDVDGSAERVGDGFSVRLAKPKTAPFKLDGAILLPTEHLKRLIGAAGAGQQILEVKVFDGSPDGKRVYDTLAIIGGESKGQDVEAAAKKPELVQIKRYPVTLSYFEPGTGERTPAYVLGFELYENGVSRALKLDYGGFALKGELTSVEFLKATPCRK